MIEIEGNGRTRRVLYDAGISPDGLVGNLDRLGIAPDSFEAIVLSHGHFDHVGGLDGLIKRVGGRNLPVVLHPDFWTRRRLVSEQQVIELPTPSRSALEGAGFQIIEDRQPSFLLDGMLLITGEIPPANRLRDWHAAWTPGLAGRVRAARSVRARGPGGRARTCATRAW